jgi:hypothetical protein
VSRYSRSALARSAAPERLPLALLGTGLLAAGVVGGLVGLGVFGGPRSQRPLLDPMAVDAMRAHPVAARLLAVAAGLALIVLGLRWAARSLRPEPRPDLLLPTGTGRAEADGAEATSLRVTAGAVADALAADAGALPGVARARARLVGTPSVPALRLTLWLTDGADVRTVWREVEEGVLCRARASLALPALPTAIKLELDRSSGRTRVR